MLPHFYCVGELDASVLAGIFLASVRAVLCAATLAACVKDLSCARRREADKAIAAERRRARELEMLEDDRLERCRFAGKNFEQCFYYGSDSAEQADAAAPTEPALEKSRRAPPTW